MAKKGARAALLPHEMRGTDYLLLALSVPVALLVCLSSCRGGGESCDELEVFMSERIEIPDTMLSITFGHVKECRTPEPPCLVVYIDSLECHSCRVSNFGMYRFLTRLKEDKGVDALFIFSPKPEEMTGVVRHLAEQRFPFEVFVDVESEFALGNRHIPSRLDFHTFLLDSEGHPAFVGDPVAEDGMWEALLRAIDELQYPAKKVIEEN